MTTTERTADGFRAGPIDGYSHPAWWLMETGYPMISIACDACRRAIIDAAWKRHNDKVRATRMKDSDIAATTENKGACRCDICGKKAQ